MKCFERTLILFGHFNLIRLSSNCHLFIFLAVVVFVSSGKRGRSSEALANTSKELLIYGIILLCSALVVLSSMHEIIDLQRSQSPGKVV